MIFENILAKLKLNYIKFLTLRKLVFFKVEMSGGGGECLCVCVVARGLFWWWWCVRQGGCLGGGGGPRQGQVVVSG